MVASRPPSNVAEVDTRSEAEEALFWRDEVLEATYWMVEEGIADRVGVDDLVGFLDCGADRIRSTLEDLVESGHLEPADGGYAFTDKGEAAAARAFEASFHDIQGFGETHTQCGPDCWCHDVDHADDPCPSETHDHA